MAADPDLQRLVAQIKKDEDELRLPSFSPDDAWTIGSGIRDLFLHLQKSDVTIPDIYKGLSKENGIVIHIETFTGHTLFSCTAGNPSAVKPDNWLWVNGKKNIVKRFHKSSYGVGTECRLKGKTPEEAGYRLPEYSAHGGGFPVWVQGATVAPVAVIVVSGLAQQMDHQLIVDVLGSHIEQMTTLA